MGTTASSRCEAERDENNSASLPPPSMPRSESVEEKMWRKIKKEPLVPIGCAATAYFLFSGIRSFQKRDPVNSQRMMRNRVIAQFVTLVCFIGYMGLDQADFRVAPMVQDRIAADKEKQKNVNSAGDTKTSAQQSA